MNTEKMNYLPYAQNEFGVSLDSGERVVYTAKMRSLYAVEGMFMGLNWKYFTLTNRRLILMSTNNYSFDFDLEKDIGSIELIQGGLNQFFRTFFKVQLRTAVQFFDYEGNPAYTCGFHVFFPGEAKKQLAAILERI